MKSRFCKIVFVLLATPILSVGTPRVVAAQQYTVTDLGTLGGTESLAYAINDSGQIVGHFKPAEGPDHAFVYEAGVMQDLGTLEGGRTIAYDINNARQRTWQILKMDD